ncbi:MAG TPA: DinB family protein [Acidimicrobiia bacterium]
MTDGARCDECGYVYDDVGTPDIAPRLRALGPSFAAVLAHEPAGRLRAHPLPETWSALEYACHVRDILHVQRERVELMLREHEPTFTPMGREELVTRERYNSQDPVQVATQLTDAADRLAELFAGLSAAQLARTGVYNWPTQQLRSAAWVGRHTVHEGVHHRADIDRVLAALA